MSWSEEQIFDALKGKYNENEWVLLPQVRSATGGYVERTADAIAMNCWRSRGLVLHGFEFKSSRGDWRRELKAPEKAEQSIYRFCNRWWIVTGSPNIIKEGELPPTWGWAAPVGGKLKILVKAPKLNPDPLDRAFVASVLRNIRDKAGLPESLLRKKFSEGYEAGRRDTLQRAKDADKHWKTVHDQLLAVHREFEQASGLRINRWDGPAVGELVRLLRSFRPTELIQQSKKLWERQLHQIQMRLTELERAEAEALALEEARAKARKARKKAKAARPGRKRRRPEAPDTT